jgi:hypothetical protein
MPIDRPCWSLAPTRKGTLGADIVIDGRATEGRPEFVNSRNGAHEQPSAAVRAERRFADVGLTGSSDLREGNIVESVSMARHGYAVAGLLPASMSRCWVFNSIGKS